MTKLQQLAAMRMLALLLVVGCASSPTEPDPCRYAKIAREDLGALLSLVRNIASTPVPSELDCDEMRGALLRFYGYVHGFNARGGQIRTHLSHNVGRVRFGIEHSWCMNPDGTTSDPVRFHRDVLLDSLDLATKQLESSFSSCTN